MTLKDHLRSLGDKEFLEELANSEPRSKDEKEDGQEEAKKEEESKVEEAPLSEKKSAPEKKESNPVLRREPGPVKAAKSSSPSKLPDSIVTITADGRTAKGFVVDSNGSILTNLHLVRGAEKIRIEFASGDIFLGRVAREDAGRDLAVVRIPGQTPVFASLGSVAGLDVGDSVLVRAKAAGGTGQLVQATVCALRKIDGTSFVQVDQIMAPQDSGSPFLDSDGKILGISNVRSGDSTPDVAFAVSVNEVKSFLSGQ